MRYVNFLLVFIVIFCYTGVSSKIYYSPTSLNTPSCHTIHKESHKQETRRSDSLSGYYKNTDIAKHEILGCCHDALPNAHYSHDFNLRDISYLIVFSTPTLEINVFSSPSSIETKRE